MDTPELPEGIDRDILEKLRKKIRQGADAGKTPDESLDPREEKEKLEMVAGHGALLLTLRALQEETDTSKWWEAYHPEEAQRLADLVRTDLRSLFLEHRAKKLAADVLMSVNRLKNNRENGEGISVRNNEGVYVTEKEGGGK